MPGPQAIDDDVADRAPAERVLVLGGHEDGRRLALMLHSGGFHDVRVVARDEDLVRCLADGAVACVVADPAAAGLDAGSVASRVAEADVPMVLLGDAGPEATRIAHARVDKPVAADRLQVAVGQAHVEALRRAAERAAERAGGEAVSRAVGHGVDHPVADIVGCSPALLAAVRDAQAVAASREPVLITGESGTGKDLLAQLVHRASLRRGEIVAVNVAGFDDALFSDALFGHRRGAYTGATEPRLGLVLRASGGTLFLDEIGDLAVASQVKLLRLLENASYLPIGEDVERRSSARIVAATSAPLATLMAGRMRADLFYRLRVHHLHLPPLRERLEDVPALADHFVRKAGIALRRRVRLPPAAHDALLAHAWPGNIRELRSVIFDAAARARGDVIELADLRRALGGVVPVARPTAVRFPEALPTLAAMQELLVDEALARAEGNQAIAARLLGVTRQALNKRLTRRLSAPRGG